MKNLIKPNKNTYVVFVIIICIGILALASISLVIYVRYQYKANLYKETHLIK